MEETIELDEIYRSSRILKKALKKGVIPSEVRQSFESYQDVISKSNGNKEAIVIENQDNFVPVLILLDWCNEQSKSMRSLIKKELEQERDFCYPKKAAKKWKCTALIIATEQITKFLKQKFLYPEGNI